MDRCLQGKQEKKKYFYMKDFFLIFNSFIAILIYCLYKVEYIEIEFLCMHVLYLSGPGRGIGKLYAAQTLEYSFTLVVYVTFGG